MNEPQRDPSDAVVTEGVGESPEVASSSADATQVAPRSMTRRRLLGRGAKLLVYTAPMIQLFRPPQALGATGYT